MKKFGLSHIHLAVRAKIADKFKSCPKKCILCKIFYMFLMTLFLTFFLKRSRKSFSCMRAIRVEFHKHCIAGRLDSIWYCGSTKFFSQYWWCCLSAVSDFKIILGTRFMVFNLEVKLLCYTFVQESLISIWVILSYIKGSFKFERYNGSRRNSDFPNTVFIEWVAYWIIERLYFSWLCINGSTGRRNYRKWILKKL